MMTENVEQEGQYVNKSYVSNQLRSNQIRNKKNSLPHDRERLYAENIELKSKVKQLTEINLKLRTQLSINQKEKVNLCNIAEEELFHPKLGARSHTGHKKSVTNIISQQQNGQSLFNNVIQKEKQSIAFKKIVRDQNIEMQKLNNQIQRLKKTMKYTRMNEILAQNTQLLNQTLRLKDVIAQIKQNQNGVYSDYANQIENLRKKINNEKDSEKRNGFELKKQLEINSELKEKLSQIQSKKIDLEKRFNKEIKQYRNEISDLKSKLLEHVSFKGRQCEKQQCVKIRKERLQLKKKIQNYQKDVKRLNGEIQQKVKLLNQKDLEYKKIQQVSSIPKTPENKQKNNSNVKKEESKNKETQSKLNQKNQQKIHLEDQSKKKEKSESIITNKTISKVQIVTPQMQAAEKKQKKKTHQIAKESEVKDKVVEKTKTKQNNDSIDTQKLLQSQEFQKTDNLKIESASLIRQEKENQKSKPIEVNKKKQKVVEQVKNKLAQSDGQYQNLDYDQFQDEHEKNEKEKQEEKKKKKNSQKESKKQKQKNTIEEEKPKKQAKKTKQHSTKKLQPSAKNKDDQEQILYSAEKQKETKQVEGDKEELKLIRDTLIYKFMAQNYSFQNFCNDINSSDMKEFTITDIMNLLNGQPFLLHDQQIQLVVIYLFDTTQPTGEQSLTAKEFIKKMKKFIGKAKAIKQEQQSTNIQLLSQIILKDEQGDKKMRKKWKEMDGGEGSITVDQFKKVMSSFKVKDSLLQTAISQIAYVSQDLNHLNYDFFLKRFLQAEN